MKSRAIALIAASTLVFAGHAIADHNSAESLAKRIGAVGSLKIMTTEEAAAARAEAAAAAASAAATEVAAMPADGESVYKTACFACHDTGVSGSPKIGDIPAWAPRIAQGPEVLLDHAINGFQGTAGVMPAKGGVMTLTNEQVSAAVDYIIQASR